MKRWFVVYTKAAQERLAETHLKAQGYQTYLPLLAEPCRVAGGKSKLPVPLFSRYLFVRLDLENEPWRCIMSTIGVIRLITFGATPSWIADSVVAEIKDRESSEGMIFPTEPVFETGEKVAIGQPAFNTVQGLFEARSGAQRAMVMISLLGRDVPVTVAQERLKRAS